MAEKKMGRPRLEIDKKQFESLCGLQCTLEEIADFFQCSEDTIERWCKREYESTFAETFKKHSGKGKISLRRAQFKLAEKNASMAIWLGKQYLHQKDYFVDDAKNKDTMEKLDGLLKEFQDAVKSEAN
jgi:AraC-like DNA-binding protein